MEKITKVKTGSKYEEMASYSRVVAVGDHIYVSNTAGRNPETKEIAKDVTEQAHQVIDIIERALVAVGSCLADVVAIRVYVPTPTDVSTVGSVLGEKFNGIDPALTMTCCPLGSEEYKVEIDATAFRGASKLESEYLDISN